MSHHCRDAYVELLASTIEVYQRDLQQRYPRISCISFDVRKLVKRCRAVHKRIQSEARYFGREPVASSGEFPLISAALTKIHKQSKADFVAMRAELTRAQLNDVPALDDLDDPEFWTSEPQHRCCPSGAMPPDWSDRRRLVVARDNFRCLRCGRDLTSATPHVHHIRRRSEGGDHAFDNLVTTCRDCHELMPRHGVHLTSPARRIAAIRPIIEGVQTVTFHAWSICLLHRAASVAQHEHGIEVVPEPPWDDDFLLD